MDITNKIKIFNNEFHKILNMITMLKILLLVNQNNQLISFMNKIKDKKSFNKFNQEDQLCNLNKNFKNKNRNQKMNHVLFNFLIFNNLFRSDYLKIVKIELIIKIKIIERVRKISIVVR